jgi:hypothetical protein
MKQTWSTPVRYMGIFGAISIAARLVAACSSVPQEQVQLYTQAFAEAEAAGNLVYDQISPIVARQPATNAPADAAIVAPAAGPGTGSNQAGSLTEYQAEKADPCAGDLGPQPFEPCFDPDTVTAGAVPGEPAEVKARRRAMATIALYNNLLLRLNSGATSNELGGEVRQLSSNLGGVLQFVNAAAGPIAGLAGDTLARLAELQERVRADRELRTALVQGEPVIQELITALIHETPTLYAIKLGATQKELIPFRTQINETRTEIRALVRGHAAPGDGRLVELSGRLEQAFGKVGVESMALPPLAGEQASQPFNATVDQQLTRKVEAVEQLTSQYMDKAVTLHSFHAALGAYVAMLHDTGTALADLAETAAAPRMIAIDAGELARQVADIRNNAGEIQRLLQNA